MLTLPRRFQTRPAYTILGALAAIPGASIGSYLILFTANEALAFVALASGTAALWSWICWPKSPTRLKMLLVGMSVVTLALFTSGVVGQALFMATFPYDLPVGKFVGRSLWEGVRAVGLSVFYLILAPQVLWGLVSVLFTDRM